MNNNKSRSLKTSIKKWMEKRRSPIQLFKSVERKQLGSSIKNTVKTKVEKEQIKSAIAKNDFLNTILTGKCLEEIIDIIYSENVTAGEIKIKRGDVGSKMFISAHGSYEIILNEKPKNKFIFDDVRVFGELAILYDTKRTATIRAATNGKLWVLDSIDYKHLTTYSEREEQEERIKFLEKIPNLNTVPSDVLIHVASLLVSKFYESGTEIVKEGEDGDNFFIIKAGEVKITKSKGGVIGTLGKGYYFGELALICNTKRSATVTVSSSGAECLELSRQHFIDHFGDIEDFSKLNHQAELKKLRTSIDEKYKSIKLENLKMIQTLGVGGFGRVDLVQDKLNPNEIFALKYMKKYKITKKEQRQHVFNEKDVQMFCDSDFIIKLYKTFRDDKCVYFLVEPGLGGDVWRLMYRQRKRPFNNVEAKFYSGCVISAFQYLHERGMVYRDLKPENLLICCNGYVKLTDFGFSKKLGHAKTSTFVGTPEYIAPELLLSKPHDKAVDYWALGVFIYELLNCKTPFKALGNSSFTATYRNILKGVDDISFPAHMTESAKNLVRRLCKYNPNERLGCLKNGVMDIKEHLWFVSFNWDGLEKLSIQPPHIPKLKSPTDTKYFDAYEKDTEGTLTDSTGWDSDF